MHSLDTQQADAAADVCDLNRVTHHATLISELRAITNVSLAFGVNPTRSPSKRRHNHLERIYLRCLGNVPQTHHSLGVCRHGVPGNASVTMKVREKEWRKEVGVEGRAQKKQVKKSRGGSRPNSNNNWLQKRKKMLSTHRLSSP
jgi:hypothetical protein